MYRSRLCALLLVLNLWSVGVRSPVAAAQKYAPLVGEWRVDLRLADTEHQLTFITDGEGQGGFGDGELHVLVDGATARSFPAAWNNRAPDTARICSEVELGAGAGAVRGTLILKANLAPGLAIPGRAVVIDGEWQRHEGVFEMRRTKGPTEILAGGSGMSLR